jgi:DNA polymerase elongation subunit (family B)
MTDKKQFKRLFFDLETSYNIVSSWRIGYNLNLSPENIIRERAIICVSFKWEHEDKVHSIEWNKGNDKKLLLELSKIMNEADEVIGHNSDRFDLKWIRTRCIFHNIPLIPDFQSIDTLKLAKKGFNFNSNKLDYIGKFLGVGEKIKTGGLDLWNRIIFNNDKEAMVDMVKYCEQDVLLLEAVYKRLSPYITHKSHRGLVNCKSIISCPECSSERMISNGIRTSATGIVKRRLHCADCGRYHSVLESSYNKAITINNN